MLAVIHVGFSSLDRFASRADLRRGSSMYRKDVKRGVTPSL